MFRRFLLAAAFLTLSATTAQAGYEEGEAAYQKKDWARAISELRPAAEAGDSRALFTLGKMYLDGNGVASDAAEAMSLYLRAAALGNTLAMVSIGSMYSEGLGLPKNPRLAAAWFTRGAELGDPLSALFAGLLLFKLSPEKPAQAYQWLTFAAGAKNNQKVAEAAQAIRPAVGNRLSPTDKAAAEQAVQSWKPKTPRDLGPLPSAKDFPAE